jgi:hypothetical protein
MVLVSASIGLLDWLRVGQWATWEGGGVVCCLSVCT